MPGATASNDRQSCRPSASLWHRTGAACPIAIRTPDLVDEGACQNSGVIGSPPVYMRDVTSSRCTSTIEPTRTATLVPSSDDPIRVTARAPTPIATEIVCSVDAPGCSQFVVELVSLLGPQICVDDVRGGSIVAVPASMPTQAAQIDAAGQSPPNVTTRSRSASTPNESCG